jgi:predicted SprT family Zn-dependent metalloprotease
MAKGTRITVDLGNEELLKSVKIAAVEQGKSVRGIVIEALKQWLEKNKSPRGKDFQTMMQTINEYRRISGQNSR